MVIDFRSLFLFLVAVVRAQDEVIQLKNEPCINWEATAAAYQAAFAQWQEPACYTFTYTFLGFSVGEPAGVTQTVRNGASLQEGDRKQFQTLADVWNLIDEQCIQNCPLNGAHLCDVVYATTNDEDGGLVYPTLVSIDPDSIVIDEELIYRIEDVRVLNCAELDAEDVVEEETVIKPDLCVNYEAVKTNLETALLKWEQVGDCYNYTIERIGRVLEEYRGPFQIVVKDGVADMVSATPQTDMTRTLSDWLTEIQDMCVDQCRVDNSEDPYYECSIEYDMTLGYPSSIAFDPDQFIVDEELYYSITNFSICEEEEVPKAQVCIDYDVVKADFESALEKWNLVDRCYSYIIERQGRISDEFRGPFEVQVRDGVPQVMNMPTSNNGPNMTFTLSDWMAEIDEHCVAGCELPYNADAYYYCSLEYDSTWGYPTSIFFDPNENVADEELYYTLSNLTPCESGVVPETGHHETFNCSDGSDDAYAFEAAYAKLETLLADNPCYDFTYIAIGFLYPPPEPVTVNFRDKSTASERSDDEFASLLDVMTFYEKTCFPCNDTVRPFACSITFDRLGVPTNLWIDYIEMLADEEMGYTMSNVTFVPCSAGPSQQDCDSGWSQAKAKWSSPACYDYSVRRVGEIPLEREGPFTVQVRDNKVTNGSAISVNMTLNDMFALIEEKCITGCPDTEAFQCMNTYDAEFGFPTRININYDELMADEEEIYVISDFSSVACEFENEDGGAATMCQDWEQLRDVIRTMEEKWEDPPCYQYSIKANEEAVITVHVRDSIVVSPESETSEGSVQPGTIDEFIAGIRATCVDGCPSSGLASCAYESAGDGPIGDWVITETKESTTNITLSDYEVVSCDREIVTSVEDTSANAAGSTMTTELIAAFAFLLLQ